MAARNLSRNCPAPSPMYAWERAGVGADAESCAARQTAQGDFDVNPLSIGRCTAAHRRNMSRSQLLQHFEGDAAEEQRVTQSSELSSAAARLIAGLCAPCDQPRPLPAT